MAQADERPGSQETRSEAGGADETLRRLEERLDRASDAAERLLAEAADSAARAARAAAGTAAAAADRVARETPPAGWQVPTTDEEPSSRGDIELLTGVIQSLRDLVPPDLQRRLAEALRELLLAIRALIDWYLERSERDRGSPDEVQDIPIA
jgi:hypothetical protein